MARILIVDDAGFMRHHLKTLLTHVGHTVVAEASNGMEAIERYKSVRPEVVTMDITMPEMDGISAIQGIRAFDPRAKIVVCSALGQQSRVIDAIQAGACDFVVKPFDEERLTTAIKVALAR